MQNLRELEDKYDVIIIPYILHSGVQRLQRYEIGVEGKTYKRKLTLSQLKKCLITEKDDIELFRKQVIELFK